MTVRSGLAQSFGSMARVLASVFCALQLLAITLGAFAAAQLSQRENAPWSGPVVTAIGAILVVAFSSYLCWKAVLALRARQPPTEAKTVAALISVTVGAWFTIYAGRFYVLALGFLAADSAEMRYWDVILAGGITVSVFAACCWIWWGSLIVAQGRLQRGQDLLAFLVAALPGAVFATAWWVISHLRW